MIVHDPAILHTQNPPRRLRHAAVVRHDDEGRALLLVEIGQQRHDLVAGLGVEAAGGLVGQDQRGLIGQRARHGDPLALPAAELAR